MSYLVYLTLVPPILIGLLLAAWLIIPTRKGNLLLLASLGIPMGFGIISCLLFLWSYIFYPSFPGFWIIEILLIGFLFYINLKNRNEIKYYLPNVKKWSWLDWLLRLSFILVALIGILAFMDYVKTNPHGRYDAWAIWNVRARMIFRGGENWKSVFVPQLFHGDYPMMIPFTIAHSWLMAGTESMRIPPMVAFLFTYSIPGIITGALLSMGKKQVSWLAGLILLSTPWLIFFGSVQFSDVPLAANILSASVCLCMVFMDRESKLTWAFLAGLFCGLASWTKNEGQLFLLVFIFVVVFGFIFSFEKCERNKRFLYLALGLLLPVFVLFLFKFTLAPANDVVDTNNLSPALTNLTIFSRYSEVLKTMKPYYSIFGGWYGAIPVFFFLCGLILLPRLTKENKASVLSIAAILLLQWTGYFFIYVITPHDLQTHINQSYSRLLMHMYPAFILLLFLFLHPIEKEKGIKEFNHNLT